MQQRVSVNGFLETNDYNNYGATQIFPGGYFALPTNSGDHSRSTFAAVPKRLPVLCVRATGATAASLGTIDVTGVTGTGTDTTATGTLVKALQREWPVIAASTFIMLLMVVLTASLGYLFEHDAQPEKFENIPQAIYWAVITLASVGYGDISPVTPMGRLLTVILALMGIGIFAIPAGLLASAFTDQLRIEREAFKAKLLHAYHNEGKLDAKARAILAEETERLHLSAEDIKRLTEEAKASFEDQKNEERKQIRAIVIDPQVHPELAYDQLRLLVQQLKLISQASGAEQLMSHIDPHHVDAELTRQVLMLMRSQASDITSDS